MNKTTTKISIIIWSIILIVAIAAFAIAATLHTRREGVINMNRSTFEPVKEEIISNEIRNISIDWVSGYVNILKSETNEIKVVQKAANDFPENKKLSIKLSDDSLTIDQFPKRIFNFLSLWPKVSDLDVYLPEREYDLFRADLVSSRLTGHDIKARKVKIDNVSGSIELTGKFEDVKTDTVSGSVQISGSMQTVNTDTVSGSVTINSSTMLKSLKSDAVSGNTTISIPENDGFTLKFDKVSASMNSDFPMSKDDETYQYKNGYALFDVDTVSGSLLILKNTAPAITE